MTAGPDPNERATPGEQSPAGTPPDPHEVPTTSLEVAPAPPGDSAPPSLSATHPSLPSTPALAPVPPVPSAPPVQASMVAAGGDQCPSCNANMAADQRYCLECGRRRGDPRLPFMDAVVFMEAMQRPSEAAAPPPSPPRERKPWMTANSSLIAGIATLVLAIGVGVVIGRSGENGSSNAANAAPQIIKVGGGSETETTTPTKGADSGGSNGKSSDKSKKATAKSETGASGTTKAAEEVLKPAGNVKLPPPETQVGGKCEKGTAGCSKGGEFNGNFFGE